MWYVVLLCVALGRITVSYVISCEDVKSRKLRELGGQRQLYMKDSIALRCTTPIVLTESKS